MNSISLSDLPTFKCSGKSAFVTHHKLAWPQLRPLLPDRMDLRTTCSLGYEVLSTRYVLGSLEDTRTGGINDRLRTVQLVDQLIKEEPSWKDHITSVLGALTKRLQGLQVEPGEKEGGWKYKMDVCLLGIRAKENGLHPSDKAALDAQIKAMTLRSGDPPKVLEYTAQLLSMSLPTSNKIESFEFDDLLWLPVVLKLQVPYFDLLCYSSKQTFKPVEKLLIDSWREAGTKILVVSEAPC